MTWGTLIARGLRFHWRGHLGVLLGAALGTAILTGALAVGDSVRFSLRQLALARLGEVRLALHSQGRFFRAALADELATELRTPVAPALILRGTAAGEGGDARASRVQVIGVDARFWQLGGARPPRGWESEEAVLNERLAAKLAPGPGSELILRIEKPSLLSRDAPLSTVEDASVTLRLPIGAVAGDAEFGRFGLEANQIPPLNVFIPLAILQRTIGMPGRANALLTGTGRDRSPTVAEANQALWHRWQIADAGLELRKLPGRGLLQLTSDQIFIDPAVAQAATSALPGARGVLTYFVNQLGAGSRATPYSMVSALAPTQAPLSPGQRDDEIVINQWLADDLEARPGDDLRLTYFVVGPLRHLEEQSRTFHIRSVVPVRAAAADRDLMPAFPGVAESRNCRDWSPGIPINLGRIRDKDEAYWHAYRGTPKAFVTLRAGQQMWQNRFGSLTAVRYPLAAAGPRAPGAANAREQAEACIRLALNPASVGLYFQPVREQALAATAQAIDFGQLFLGFSLFLIAAALLLTALLFTLGVEQRSEEVGILLALGFPLRRVRLLLMLEGAALAVVAGVAGTAAGALYTRLVIRGLSTVWRGAVANAPLRYHVDPATLATGFVAGVLAALFSIWLVTRKQGAAPARELLAFGAEGGAHAAERKGQRARRRGQSAEGKGPNPEDRTPSALRFALCILPVAGAFALIAAALMAGREQAAGYFFGAGALLLFGGIMACRELLARLDRSSAGEPLSLGSLGRRNSARRVGRSLSAIALLACGSFLVVAVGASRSDSSAGAQRRASGTGGFAFYGETTLPVYQDLNSPAGRDQFGLDANTIGGATVLPLRLRDGDEASCLNLNRAQVPRILGVAPEALAQRRAFTFVSKMDGERGGDPWSLLNRREKDGAIPAVGDENTVVWSLGKSLGSTVPMVDDQGRPLNLRIVGILANSILQGSLLISEENYTRRFASRSGYQVFLIDAPPGRARDAGRELARGLEDVGLELTPTSERLATFSTVENTYLSIFAVLGGLGLLLGSLGLGVVVLRNVLERRGELALLRAVGFRPGALRRLVLSEHLLLLSLGLLVGILAALVAVFPSLRSPGTQVPFGSLTATLAAVGLSGLAWTWGASVLALRGDILPALRNE